MRAFLLFLLVLSAAYVVTMAVGVLGGFGAQTPTELGASLFGIFGQSVLAGFVIRELFVTRKSA